MKKDTPGVEVWPGGGRQTKGGQSRVANLRAHAEFLNFVLQLGPRDAGCLFVLPRLFSTCFWIHVGLGRVVKEVR
jgi:hypothetical protein